MRVPSPKPTTRALVMSSFPEQNDPHYSKKIPLICSKFRFSDYISISKIHVSTVRIPLPDRKVLFDSFVKRKLRLPMSRGHVLFLEFFRIYSIKKMCYVHKIYYSRLCFTGAVTVPNESYHF